jgi:hypothetical protein
LCEGIVVLAMLVGSILDTGLAATVLVTDAEESDT